MPTDIISKKTRYELREWLVGAKVLREIEIEFDSVDIARDDTYQPAVSGARRTFIEQHYRTLDFTKPMDAQKFLRLCQNLMSAAPAESPLHTSTAKWLKKDGFVFENGQLVPLGNVPALSTIRAVAVEFDADQLHQQIARIQAAIETDPALAIGSAKELIETCCKTILKERGKPLQGMPDIIELVKLARAELKLVPDDIPEAAKGADTIKRLLSNLAQVAQGLAELRRLYGTGHGHEGRVQGLRPRHARLAAYSACALAQFLFDTHKDRG